MVELYRRLPEPITASRGEPAVAPDDRALTRRSLLQAGASVGAVAAVAGSTS